MGLPLFRVTPPPLIFLPLRIMFPPWVCIKPEPENLIASSLVMLIVPPFVVSAIAPASSVPLVIAPWRLSRLKARCPSYSVFRLNPHRITFFNQPRRNFSRTHHPWQPRTRMRSRPHKIEIRNILTPIMRTKPSRLRENRFHGKRTA